MEIYVVQEMNLAIPNGSISQELETGTVITTRGVNGTWWMMNC